FDPGAQQTQARYRQLRRLCRQRQGTHRQQGLIRGRSSSAGAELIKGDYAVAGAGMSFELTDDQQLIRASVAELASKFDDHYWMEKDLAHEFPQEFYDAIATGGWLGMTNPEEYGGDGLGITEATLLLEEGGRSGAAMNGASAIHLTIFGMQPVVKHGSDELKARTLPRI